MSIPPIGVIGGSGLYELEGLTDREEIAMKTPFGDPSDSLIKGKFAGREVIFLPRHARGHRLLPTEIPHRANLWALRSLGVRFIICVTAVGSLKEEYAPGHVLIPDQYYDRTSSRKEQTFFGNGIAAHVSPAEPYSKNLSEILAQATEKSELTVHRGGTYVNMDGPSFSTRAESLAHKAQGFDLIGMTNVTEAKLAREAEIALASLCMVTDYDAWRPEEDAVNTQSVFETLMKNAANAKAILAKALPEIPEEANWPEHSSLAMAFATPKKAWPTKIITRLEPLLKPYL
jgi:5'-methylthioadenosine phosphorylase